ncbi:MAG: hypothetical protein EOM23_04190, partial [Candidatus Moranbacteria bacterium]|nr:hypothetical protein [Candidatus Moranbacteria bacterium]
MVKFFKIAIVVLLILANAAAITVAALQYGQYEGYRVTPSGKPLIGEKLDLTIPNSGDTEALKLFAYNLYATANENFKNLENAAYSVNSVTTTMGTPVYGYRHVVKNADEYLYLEYSFVPETLLGALVGAVSTASTKFAERSYTNASMNYLYSEKTLEPTHSVIENEIIYNADWDNLFFAKQKQKPIYYADQDTDFEYTDQKIRPETIKTVSVTYYEQEGYYRLEMDLDVQLPFTTSITLPNLRENSGSDNAAYTSMSEVIEIWDNGYYKYFLSEDAWSGTLTEPIKMNLSSEIRFETDFLYDQDSLSFSKYQYAEDLIALVKNGNMRTV